MGLLYPALYLLCRLRVAGWLTRTVPVLQHQTRGRFYSPYSTRPSCRRHLVQPPACTLFAPRDRSRERQKQTPTGWRAGTDRASQSALRILCPGGFPRPGFPHYWGL